MCTAQPEYHITVHHGNSQELSDKFSLWMPLRQLGPEHERLVCQVLYKCGQITWLIITIQVYIKYRSEYIIQLGWTLKLVYSSFASSDAAV